MAIPPVSPFIPLALEEEDIATYAAMAEGLGCDTETCAEAFMLATPLARETAVRLWRGLIQGPGGGPSERPDEAAGGPARRLQDGRALGAMKALLGLDPARMPVAALAAAGLRYSA
ncbi:polysaccharide deacetylase [Pseudoroseomonas sp. WGS1072]|uniref:polysaccharide deacetylase n=1 Tax=Roseomonas sp. WGS1072 TaxID=3366816 RepID=UPI000DAFE57B|nr:MAG: polysaccharide deacetylase [Pseudoxanthomonas suwonensis]